MSVLTATQEVAPSKSPIRRTLVALALATSVGAACVGATTIEHNIASSTSSGTSFGAAKKAQCWYKGWFKEDGVWYQGWFKEAC